MTIAGRQIREARALLGLPRNELAAKVTIVRAESVDGEPPITTAQAAAIQQALERAGVEFIPETGGGAGRRGQNTQRPARANATGRKVSMTINVQAMPMADTGPRLLFEFSSEKVRQSRPMITVTPEARMAGADCRQALIIASERRA